VARFIISLLISEITSLIKVKESIYLGLTPVHISSGPQILSKKVYNIQYWTM
jgi:hypothetical protein